MENGGRHIGYLFTYWLCSMKKSIKIGFYLIFGILIISFSIFMISKNFKGTYSASASPCLDKNDYCPITTEITATTANTYDVTSASFGANGSDNASDSAAIQAALNKALTSSTPIKVVVPAGTYYISSALYIYSNTILSLNANAIFARMDGSSGYILKTKADANKPGHTQWENMIIEGGTWDLREISNGFHLVHGENLIIRNTTVKNGAPTSHTVNLSATKNVIVSNNTFKNQSFAEDSTRAPMINEFLHIDPALDNEESAVPIDGTPIQNFVLEHNTFDNVLSGIGSHSTAVPFNSDGTSNMDTNLNIYQCTKMGTNIKIRNNTFKNVHYDAINILFHHDVEIYGNTATGASDNTQGVFVYTSNTGAKIHDNTVNGFVHNVVLIAEHTKHYKSAYDIIYNGNLIYKHDEGEIPSECAPGTDFALAGANDSEVSAATKTTLGVSNRYVVVKYYANGGTGSMADSHNGWSTKTTPNAFTRNGYHFIGWKVQRERTKTYLAVFKDENGNDKTPEYALQSTIESSDGRYYICSSGVTLIKRDMLHQGEILNFIAQWKQIKNIQVSTLPTKVVYSPIDTGVDATGGKLMITFTDNTTEEIDLSNATFSGFVKGKTGNQTITVTYAGKTATFNVSVDSKYVLIKFHINGGTLATAHDARIGVNNNYITLNNEILVTAIAYGDSLTSSGLVNYNNASYINIQKAGYVGKNKAEWNTKTDGTGTSYSQAKAYSSDDFCDASSNICEVTLYVNWVPDNIEAVLSVDNNIVNSITAGTNFASIISQVQTTQTIVLYDNAGNIKSNSEVLKTGDYVTITQNETTASYYISVLGDVNGDGNVNEIDVAKLFQHYRGTTPIPANQQYYILAGDVVSDNTIKLTDVAKLFQYFRGTVLSLN